ncbi:hypothetical protein HC766_03245 [Candidatus Gracilibacteria bacterium]|nr:hypothetical protein [Candidatus Gracilibacteria bacterium]NJS41369.1 hypothetical protein [Candidatus Gracilibacteria bacterium]
MSKRKDLTESHLVAVLTILGFFCVSVFGQFGQVNVQAAECTWQGGINSNFEDAGNWTGCGGNAPGASDIAVFPSQPSPITVDLNTNFYSIGGITMNGNVTLNKLSDFASFSGTGSSTLTYNGAGNIIDLYGILGFTTFDSQTPDSTLFHEVFLQVPASSIFSFTGNGEVTLGPDSIVQIADPVAIVKELNVSSQTKLIAQGDFIMNSTLAGSAPAYANLNIDGVVECASSTCFGPRTTVKINDGGQLDITGTNTNLTNDVQTDGQATITAEDTTTLSGDISMNEASSLQITGPNSGGFDITGVITGDGQIGTDGNVNLQSENTYTGLTTLSSGVLKLQNVNALGSTTTGTNIESGSSLEIDAGGSIGENITTFSGVNGMKTRIYHSASSNSTLTGIVTMNTDSEIDVDSEIIDFYIENLAGTGNLTKTGLGNLYLSGANENTYLGDLNVSEGGLIANKDVGKNSVTGGTATIQGLCLCLLSDNQVDDTTDIEINSGKILLNDLFMQVKETVDSVSGAGNIELLPGTELTVGADNGGGTHTGTISLIGSDQKIIKIGTGTQEFNGTEVNNPTSNFQFVQNEGVLILNGQYPLSDVVVNGGVFKGTGTVKSLTASGEVSPGVSPGVMNIAGNANFDAMTSVVIELDGETSGSQYDVIEVGGATTLGNAGLTIVPGYVPATGQVFTILNSDGGVSGTFDGLADGQIVEVTYSGQTLQYRVNYLSNSVTLTFLGVSQEDQLTPANPTLIRTDDIN